MIAGNESSDGRAAAVPATVADVLGMPALTHAREITVDASTVMVRRETDGAPPKRAGEKSTDEGDGGQEAAAFLVGQKLICVYVSRRHG